MSYDLSYLDDTSTKHNKYNLVMASGLLFKTVREKKQQVKAGRLKKLWMNNYISITFKHNHAIS